MLRLSFAFLISFVVFLNSCSAQSIGNLYSKDKKAVKYFNAAIEFYKVNRLEDASDYLFRALEKDSNFIDAYLLLADINQKQSNQPQALNYYLKTISIDPDYRPHTLYQSAILEKDMQKFEDAAGHFRAYLQHPKSDPRLKNQVHRYIDECDFAIDQVKNPVTIDPLNLGSKVNSSDDEYVNAINTENNFLILTVRHPVEGSNRPVEDFFMSFRDQDSGLWIQREPFSDIFNTQFDEGAMVISPDGSLIVFASNRIAGFGRFDLYYSKKINGIWSQPENMGEGVNTEYWESQPTISSDGKTIYFVSDRRGGLGGSDIYFVALQEDGTYGKPFNLGAPINTSGNEMTPQIHQDGQTLYFVSNGHIGMGKSDMFMAKKDKNGLFTNVTNLGYPINSSGDELGLIVDARGQLAYFSSDKYDGFGGYDIYSFELPNHLKPQPVTYLKGVAYDKFTKEKLKVKFELTDLATGAVILQSYSDQKTGSFLVCVTSGKELGLTASIDGYLFFSDHFNVDAIAEMDKPFLKDIPMIPLKKGEKIVLRNILYATNSFELRSESMPELAKLLDLLNKNPKLEIEISGHTDNIGDENENQLLSENRAKSVYDYLISNGIDAARLKFIGYGESVPIDSNESPEGRQNNRRTEIKILEF